MCTTCAAAGRSWCSRRRGIWPWVKSPVSPSEQSNPATKIPTKMGGAPTPSWDPIGFDPQPYECVCVCVFSGARHPYFEGHVGKHRRTSRGPRRVFLRLGIWSQAQGLCLPLPFDRGSGVGVGRGIRIGFPNEIFGGSGLIWQMHVWRIHILHKCRSSWQHLRMTNLPTPLQMRPALDMTYMDCVVA